MLPGAGGAVAAFISYDTAKRWSRKPESFGQGSLEGVAAPETANNVVTGTALIPLLTFGIPGSNSAAILLAAMMLHGVQPGPLLFEQTPQTVYGLFVGMLVANLMMLVLGYLAVRPAVAVVNVQQPYLLAGILGLILVGAFAINNRMFEVWIVLGTGVLGYAMRRYGYNVLAMVLGLVLGFMVESNLRRSLLISRGDPWVFFTRPISCALLVLALTALIWPVVRQVRERKRMSSIEGD
jgi:putative tricarboxylic transport membrane protein